MAPLNVTAGQSINAAIKNAAPNSVIHCAGGVYAEDILIDSKVVFLQCDPANPAIVRSITGKNMQDGGIAGFEIVGVKVPLPQPIESTKPDDLSMGPILAKLDPAQRKLLARKKWKSVMDAFDHFDGPPSAPYSLYTVGLKLLGCSGLVITDVKASKHTAGVSIESSFHVSLERVEGFLCRVGLRSFSSVGTLMKDCKGYECLGTGAEVNNGEDVTVQNLWAKHNGIGGLIVNSASRRTKVVKGYVGWCGQFTEVMEKPGSSGVNFYAVGAGNSVDGTFVDHQTDGGCGYDGNGFINDTSLKNGVRFVNARAEGCVGAGVALTGSDNNFVDNCDFVGNKKTDKGSQVREVSSKGNTITPNNRMT